jgi:hypothetical protein
MVHLYTIRDVLLDLGNRLGGAAIADVQYSDFPVLFNLFKNLKAP